MAAFFLISFAFGVVLAIPVWLVLRRGVRRGLRVGRQVDPRDVVPCMLEPVALNGRLLAQDMPAVEVSR